MAVSLEAREPLLDHKLLEFAAAVPDVAEAEERPEQIPAAAAARAADPAGDRRSAQARVRSADRRVAARAAGADGRLAVARRPAARSRHLRRWRGHAASGASIATGRRDHRHRLWSLVMLELWFRQFVDGPAAGPLTVTRPEKRPECVASPASSLQTRRTRSGRAGTRAVVMRDVIAHRGPDEAGLHCDAHAALAHRRLSIVDLGSRPSAARRTRTARVWVIFNGEIYNHADDPRGARSSAAIATARAPTPRPSCTPTSSGATTASHRFRGMFAFAIWDAPRRRLLLVRDRLGVKPLYWARVGDSLLFGSEIKAHPRERPRRAEANDGGAAGAARHALHRPAPSTLFQGIHKLLPGHGWSSSTAGSRIAAVLGRAGRGPDPRARRARRSA